MPPSSFTDSVQRYDGERRKRDRGGAKAGDLPAPSPIMLASSVTSHEIGCIVIGVARCCMGEVKFPLLLWLMKREKLPIICTTGASVTLRERSGSVHLCAHCTQTKMGPKSTTRFDSECVRSLPRRLHPPASAVARPDQDPLPPSYPRAERLEKQM